ncbi:MAG: hypothetical protein A2X94_12985 [Bdellovibrionales bacterium GWB1_55_8]|nr:MAG: hypothetical protein A2X94_12985 [Bdellovibrionales bacterium GWB1_55_8]
MRLRGYIRLWILLSLGLAYEAFALNFVPELSLIGYLQERVPVLQGSLNPRPGGRISLWYGWAGFSLMVLTNFYVLRKRWTPLRKFGSTTGWLDFHIFCGLAGPTFILFHTNFKVGGLVAISFWSMVVSFLSGIVGRYFFVQAARQQLELERELENHELRLRQHAALLSRPGADLAVQVEAFKLRAIRLAGAQVLDEPNGQAVLKAVFSSILGDLRLHFGLRKFEPQMKATLHALAITRRRILYQAHFQQVMGYWHSFHMPFAVFMYLVAAIHIVVALLFRVSEAA